jgi:hypothetical protein
VPDRVSIEGNDSARFRFRTKKNDNHMGKPATFLALEAYIYKERIKENQMKTKIKEKVIILIIAALFAFIGFNLLVSPTAVDLIKIDNSANYEITYESQITYIS